MTPRTLLGLSFCLLTTRPLAAFAADPNLPPLEGGPAASTPKSAPPTDPPASAPVANPAPAPEAAPPASPPVATAGAETPAATAPAPDEPPPPVYEAESDFPEPEKAQSSNVGDDELYGPSAAQPIAKKEETARRRWEINLGAGFGNAFCDNDSPESDCPVDGAFAGYVGGGYRFVPHFSAGLELAFWNYAVQEDWRGQLEGEPDDVEVTSSYASLYARWYWFDKGKLDPYVQAGFGLGTVESRAKNDDFSWLFQSRGWVLPVGIGVDWQIGKVFRLGPQALVYWHHSTEICTTVNDDDEQCHNPGKDENGNREGDALPWRITINGTFTLGAR